VEEVKEVIQKEVIVEEVKDERVIKGLLAIHKVLADMSRQLEKISAKVTEAAEKEPDINHLEIVKIELQQKLDLEKMRYDNLREKETILWERSLPLSSESTDSLIAALNIIKVTEIELVRTLLNGRNSSSSDKKALGYEDMVNAYGVPLSKAGICIVSQLIPGFNPKNEDIVQTSLRHDLSEQFINSYSKVNLDFVDSNISLQQKRSSAISYAKRHNLQQLLGL
jgi:myo-inositol-1-phosphate synthase